MLDEQLIIKGPIVNYSIPKEWHLGKYIIECQQKNDPDRVLYVDGVTNEVLTSGKLVQKSLKLATLLHKIGVEKGDVVTILTENDINYIVIIVAVLYIGAIFNPLNPAYSLGELNHAFKLTKPKTIFCSQLAIKNALKLKQELDYISHIFLIEKKDEVEYHGIETLEEALGNCLGVNTVQPAEFDSLTHTAMILLSSGTTGLPKSVMLTHANIHYPLGYISHPDYINLQSNDVVLGVLPFFHILGCAPLIGTAVFSCKLIVLQSFKPDIFLKNIQEHKVTGTYTVPPIMSFLTKHPVVKQFDISSVRRIGCSGGFLGKEIQEDFHSMYPGIEIILLYGITEMTGACTILSRKNANKIGSVGFVAPYLEAIVWNSELEKNVGVLEPGELCFRGPSVMKGYIRNDSNDIDKYGFYHTGDTGYFDEDSCFYFSGRSKELIKYKGFQVPPAELEDLLLKHPAVKDCGVIGIPHERAGQLPTALVVLQNNANVTSEEIIEYVADRISVQKRLHGGVKFTDMIPRNAAGKILRNKLLELYSTL